VLGESVPRMRRGSHAGDAVSTVMYEELLWEHMRQRLQRESDDLVEDLAIECMCGGANCERLQEMARTEVARRAEERRVRMN
jgi:hypothetical protein